MSFHVHPAPRRRELGTGGGGGGGGWSGRASPTTGASPRHRYDDEDEAEEGGGGGSITSASRAAEQRGRRRTRVEAVLPPELRGRVCADTPSLGSSMVPRAPSRRPPGEGHEEGEDTTAGGSITSGPSVELGPPFPPREVEAVVGSASEAAAVGIGGGTGPRGGGGLDAEGGLVVGRASQSPSFSASESRRRRQTTAGGMAKSTTPTMGAGNQSGAYSTTVARREFRDGMDDAASDKIGIDDFTLEAVREAVLHVPLPATVFAVATALRESESVAQLHRFSSAPAGSGDAADDHASSSTRRSVTVRGRRRRGGGGTPGQIRRGSWTDWRASNAARGRDRSAAAADAAARRRVLRQQRGGHQHPPQFGIEGMTSLVNSFGKMELSWGVGGRGGRPSSAGQDRRVRRLREALGGLSRRPESFGSRVDTWEEAREVLSEILEFPPPEETSAAESSSPAGGRGDRRQQTTRDGRKRRKGILPDSVERYVQRVRRAMAGAASTSGAASSSSSSGSGDFLTTPSTSSSHERWRQVALYTPRSSAAAVAAEGVEEEEEEAEVPTGEDDDRAKKLVVVAGEGGEMMRYLEAEAEKRRVEVEAKEAEVDDMVEARMAAREEGEREAAEAAEREVSVLPPLTEEDRELLNRALYGIGPEDEIVGTAETDTVQRASVQRLRPTKWLNDEVIHYFLTMLARRDAQLSEDRDGRRRRCHFFKSFFMTKLLGEGGYRYANVKRWSKKVPGKDIFALDKIVFPINCGGVHWTCAVIFMQERKIQFYDSLLGSGMDYLKVLLEYLKDEHRSKKNEELDTSNWSLVDCQPDTPQQENGFDCGVFTCMFADYLSRDAPLTFNQDTVTECRQRIALSIVKGRALH